MLRRVAVYGWFWMNEFGAGSFSSSTWRSSRIEWIAENPTQLGEFELFLNMKWYALFHLAFSDICWIIIKSRLAIGWIWCSLSFSFLCYLLRLFCQSEFRIMLNAHDKIAPSQEKVIDISNISIMRISMSICWIFFCLHYAEDGMQTMKLANDRFSFLHQPKIVPSYHIDHCQCTMWFRWLICVVHHWSKQFNKRRQTAWNIFNQLT